MFSCFQLLKYTAFFNVLLKYKRRVSQLSSSTSEMAATRGARTAFEPDHLISPAQCSSFTHNQYNALSLRTDIVAGAPLNKYPEKLVNKLVKFIGRDRCASDGVGSERGRDSGILRAAVAQMIPNLPVIYMQIDSVSSANV